jgi:ABC-2 type transport system ATP-binding protein
VIRVDQITKQLGGTEVLAGVSFEVDAKEVVGFVGPNGAGKTTTLRILAGFLCPDAGSVAIDGCDVVARRQAALHRIGYLPEATPLHPEMRVDEYLAFRGRLKGVGRRELAARIGEICERVALTDRRRQRIGQLSKGYRQRVGLADALIARPPVLLLDEPTSGLDPVQVRELRALFGELAADHTLLLSTHALAEVEAVCSRAIVLVGGRVVGDAPPAKLRERAGFSGDRSFEDVFVELARREGARA